MVVVGLGWLARCQWSRNGATVPEFKWDIICVVEEESGRGVEALDPRGGGG